MSSRELIGFCEDVTRLIVAGSDHVGLTLLRKHLSDIQEFAKEDPKHQPLLDAIHTTLKSDDDEVPLPLLDVVQEAEALRIESIALAEIRGELESIEEGGFWTTTLSGDVLYSLIPETRPFAKRIKAPQQVELLESAARRGQIDDLRLLQLFLKMLSNKASDELADAVAKVALPAFGPNILPELWPSLTPDSRSFLAAYQIDIEATLNRLLEKSGKRSDKSGQVMKALEMLLENVLEEGATVGPESLPLLRLGLKYAPDANFRRKIAEIIVSIGPAAQEALSDLVDAFEKGGISRDYQLVRLLIVLGKDSQEVTEALIRALEDRENSVRLMAAFNIGLLGAHAAMALPFLEDLSENDPDTRVRDQATKTLNKLRARFEPPVPLEQVGTP